MHISKEALQDTSNITTLTYLSSLNNFDYNNFFEDIYKLDAYTVHSFLSKILDIDGLDCDSLYNDLFNSGNTYDSFATVNLLKILINNSMYTNYDIVDSDTIEPNKYDYSKIGIVTGISDNIVNIVGLYDVAFGEMIEILTGSDSAMGMVLNIEESKVNAIIFSSDINIKPGQEVVSTSVLMSVPVGDNLLGRIVDPLGNPLDSLGIIIPTGHRFMDSIAPSIISRKSVNTPLETGLKLLIVWFLLDMANVN